MINVSPCHDIPVLLLGASWGNDTCHNITLIQCHVNPAMVNIAMYSWQKPSSEKKCMVIRFDLKLIGHSVTTHFHLNFYSYVLVSECFALWCFRLQAHANPFAHISHLYGMSSVCETIWRFRNLACVNVLPHVAHLCDVPVCVVICKLLDSKHCFSQ